MALPNLHLLCIGPTADIGTGTYLDILPTECVLKTNLFGTFVEGVPQEEPLDVLQKYHQNKCVLEDCRHHEVLVCLMQAYGWHKDTSNLALAFKRISRQDDELVKQLNDIDLKEYHKALKGLYNINTLQLSQLERLASMHAALYVTMKLKYVDEDDENLISCDGSLYFNNYDCTYNLQCDEPIQRPITEFYLDERSGKYNTRNVAALEVSCIHLNLSYAYIHHLGLGPLRLVYKPTWNKDVSAWSAYTIPFYQEEEVCDGTPTSRSVSLFRHFPSFEGLGVGQWAVKTLENANGMFEGCTSFNANLAKWQVDKLRSACKMFKGCKTFRGDGLENWKDRVSSITNAAGMFSGCQCIKLSNLRNWQLTNVEHVKGLFLNVTVDDGDIEHLMTMNVNLRNIADQMPSYEIDLNDKSSRMNVVIFIFGERCNNDSIIEKLSNVIHHWFKQIQ